MLSYESYVPMALKSLKGLVAGVRLKYDGIEKIVIYHRIGQVPVGECSVLIAVSAVHRRESIRAVEDLIDDLKAETPIWKREEYEDVSHPAQWKVNCECSRKQNGFSVNKQQ